MQPASLGLANAGFFRLPIVRASGLVFGGQNKPTVGYPKSFSSVYEMVLARFFPKKCEILKVEVGSP
jgi:hypothetical protein